MALSRKKKKPIVSAERCSNTSVGEGIAPQSPWNQLAGKRKANELASSGETFEPANRRPARNEGSAPLPASAPAVSSDQTAACSRQLGPSEGGVTYAAFLTKLGAPSQPSGSLKPKVHGHVFGPVRTPTLSETTNRRMSRDIYGPVIDKMDGTTQHAQVDNTYLLAEETPYKTPIFISGVRDARTFLAWLRASFLGCLTAQQKAEILMVVPSTVKVFRTAVCDLPSQDGGGCAFPHLHAPRGSLCAASGKEPGKEYALRASSERSWSHWTFVSRESRSCVTAFVTRTQPKTAHSTPTSFYRWLSVLSWPKYVQSPKSADCECPWRHKWRQKAQCNASVARASVKRSVTTDRLPGASRVMAPNSPAGAVPRGNNLSAVAWGKLHNKLEGLY